MQILRGRLGLLPLALLSVVAGAGAGLICGLFRVALDMVRALRTALPTAWSGNPVYGCLLMIGIAAVATAFAAFMVRRMSPDAAGSGIPHVEAVIEVELPPAPFALLPVKFIGGVLAMGSGLALGREGPCVQMGATLAHLVGVLFRRDWPDRQALLAAGAGAGLAAAFNAPLAGAAFVLEELLRRFEMRNAVAALGASMSAIVVARLFTGAEPDFAVAALPYPDARDNLLCIGLGLFVGVLGALYNYLLLDALDIADRMKRTPVELRAGLIGAVIGALAWFAPSLVGGGDGLTQSLLNGATPFSLLPLLFVIRLFLSCASYAAGTPGGLFAPLLVLGAQMGFFFGALAHPDLTGPNAHAILFAVVGMAALFTAVVRAPLTGIILVTEMTGSSIALLPMLAACFSAMALATMLGSRPIYDSLKVRTLRLAGKKPPKPEAASH
ncbi:Chloride channel core [Methylocella tundrae]|uniref:Chloride channel core n=1 Tax=Methylocella tundrae TaxID=227605 RepID=A0A8B6M032_METTU|nr:H(+)/Cl(-) exchange transporter ClcA [Methylocella tundrae]VTZ26308.1 Chloride channel core [Methylocella tundrae]VTZ48114.1 Chloride channel core [Methylocella tundrae]